MEFNKTRDLVLSRQARKVNNLQKSMKAREAIRYQIISDESGQCRMTIVELSVGWHKGLQDRQAILDVTAEAIAGFRYTKKPEEPLDADVFTRASIEASSNLGNGVEMSLGKAEGSVEYNAINDDWKNDVTVSKPQIRGKGKGFKIDAEKTVSYDVNAKIVGLSIKRKNCN
ncbi:hypothetical protein [Marinomonas ostreistagni]|uniref:Uncharacterized protein n=1 Tax=Marinomonas ostreistagni TaxID=359209 RepID=A0ABS0ZDG5_9GAMM|nr:hypothetical protein [Marinomonas ostreistagni]MBJ7551712.1 hypothetical protein [Marinomonas ostreistagni]